MLKLAMILVLAAAVPASAQSRIRTVAPVAVQPVSITLLFFPSSVEDIAYPTTTVTATGGTAPYTCAVTSGSMITGVTEGSECVWSGTPTTPATYTFTITVTDSLGATSSVLYAPTITEAGTPLPSGWSHTDIGTGQEFGDAFYSSPNFNVSGSGTAYNTSDKLHFAYQALTGNYEIVAEVTSLTNDSGLTGYGQAGVMVRSSLSSDASNGYCFDNAVIPIFQWRLTNGGSTDSDAGSAHRAWYRLQVNGTAVTCDYSTDGSVWTPLNTSKTLAISGTYYLGLAANSNFDDDVAYGIFDNVAITALTGGSPNPTVTDTGCYRPHYRGYGCDTKGAFGNPSVTPKVIRVNSLQGGSGSLTLNGDGTYSGRLRPALEASFPRVIVPELSGTIDGMTAYVSNPYLTIAGQTAPKCDEGTGTLNCSSGVGGITLTNSKIIQDAGQFVYQHFRMRENQSGGSTTFDCILCIGNNGADATHVQYGVLDHMSVALAGGGTPMTYVSPGAGNLLVTDSLYTWGVDSGTSPNGGYNFGVEGSSTCSVSFDRNFMGMTWGRSPTIPVICKGSVSNSIAYNGVDNSPGSSHYGFFSVTHRPNGSLSSIGGDHVYTYNVMKPGPSSGSPDGFIAVSVNSTAVPNTKMYLEGNYGTGITGQTGNGQWTGMIAYDQNVTGTSSDYNYATQGTGSNIRVNSPMSWWTAMDFVQVTNSKADIENAVMATAGAFPDASNRDSIDSTVLSQYAAGTGTWHMSVPIFNSTYGGLPTVVQRNRAFVMPSTPNATGSCGYSRTVLQCYLENDPSFGAQRLEPYQGVP